VGSIPIRSTISFPGTGMKTLWIVLLVCVVAVGAFFLGQRNAAPAAGPATAAVTPPEAASDAGDSAEGSRDTLPSAQPVRTFRGPDGKPNLITYDPANPPDNQDPVQVKAALLEDMKNHPRNIVRAYDLTEEQVAEIVAGTRPFPESMLPAPAEPAAR
jgi:hypothetical protein